MTNLHLMNKPMRKILDIEKSDHYFHINLFRTTSPINTIIGQKKKVYSLNNNSDEYFVNERNSETANDWNDKPSETVMAIMIIIMMMTMMMMMMMMMMSRNFRLNMPA
ncbi:CNT_collapsed_G0015190.mRNA.1.CDS.1 [Saccharomyces cerevisiae]|nr:CNT_collapsed_G0015190.mRNA.1.CDS.1 [Saccharomyces cerevisiae]